ncbi:hypothetical protein AB2L57_10785 [Microbacterium sp. HA-8]|uniref:hypothetical protein n=1 Tax=Microbacterium sp. HA-8 TaxID=3234200 RepID=UPI0038F6F4CA
MPWHSIASVAEDGIAARRALSQLRPSTPDIDERTGKARKYLSLPGADFKLDIHPSTPASWLTGGDDILLIEGLLKGDSVLSAQLLETYDADKLAVRETPEQARQDLHDLMEGMPARVRVLVVSAASVTMWERPDELREIGMKGRRAFVAFDGDLSVNPMVWKQANRAMTFLSRRTGTGTYAIALWDTAVEVAKIVAGIDSDAKVGMDEYLTRIGSFYGDLMDPERGLIASALPPEPQAEPDHKVGDWRVRKDCPAIVEELIASVLPDGSKGQPRWEVRSHIGLEILEVRSTRLPVEEERRTGRVLDTVDAPSIEEIVARFHVLPHDGDAEFDEVQTFDVRMPASAMAASRDGDWASLLRAGAMKLPAAVLTHAHYPPRDMKAWLAASKASSQVDVTNGWATMGWLPTGSGGAFVVGSTVIAATEAEEKSTVSGLTPAVLPRASAWGVEDHYREMTHREWETAFVADLRKALDIWFGAFASPEVAAIAWGMMLRPTMPARGAGSVLYVTGGAGKGKSYLASCIMSGYNAYAGAWTHHALPGTAADTVASTEVALSQTPIWVMDDLAPNSDAGRGSTRTSSVEDMIRGVFNGTPRRRMGDAPVPPAVAHLIVTAENAPTVESIRQRTWEVNVGSGLLVEGGRERFEEAVADGLFARIVGYAARSWVNGSHTEGTPTWTDRVRFAEDECYGEAAAYVEDIASRLLGTADLSRQARQVEKASALYGPVWALMTAYSRALEHTGGNLSGDATLKVLDDTIPEALTAHAMAAAALHAKNTPGRLALRAVANLLEAGMAHLTNAVNPGLPPVGGPAERIAAGWQMDGETWKPRGIAVGAMGAHRDSGQVLAVLSTTTAFTKAAKEFPALIPSGSTAAAAWASLDGEKDLIPDWTSAVVDRVRLSASEIEDDKATDVARVRGVVILWDGLRDLLS